MTTNILALPQLDRAQMTLDNLLGTRCTDLDVSFPDHHSSLRLHPKRDIQPWLSLHCRFSGEGGWLLLDEAVVSNLLGPEQDATIYPDPLLFALLEIQLKEPLTALGRALDIEVTQLRFEREIPDIMAGPMLGLSLLTEASPGHAVLHAPPSFARRIMAFLEHQPLRVAQPPTDLGIPGELHLARQRLTIADLRGLEPGDVFMLPVDTNANQPLLRIPGYGICQTELNHQTLTVVTAMTPEDTFSDAPPEDAVELNGLELTLDFQLGTLQLTLAELAALTEGYTFDLGALLDAPVSVKINGQTVARCELVDIEGHLGARILRMTQQPLPQAETDDE